MALAGFHRRQQLSLPQHVRDYNRASLLQRLFRQGPLSRADLAREIGLTKVTVSNLVAELIDEAILVDIGPDDRPGVPGKRPTLLRICEDGRNIVAVDLTREGHLSGAVMTLTGESMDRRRHDQPLQSGDEGVDELTRFCEGLIAASAAKVLGVGVASPGVISPTGTIVRAPKRGWFDLPLQDILAERLGLPVSVANDASSSALGEFAFGATSGSHVLSVLVGDGIGAGLVIDGQLVHGFGGAAGEIAHITATVDGDGSPWGTPSMCVCGRLGCLGMLLSEPELRAALAPLDDTARRAWLSAVGSRLGEVLAPVVAVLDLSDIVLAGPRDLLEGPLMMAAQESLQQRVWPSMNPIPRFAVSALEDRAPLVGAGVLVLSHTLGIP